MLDQVSWDAGHVCGFPCENAFVVPEKPDESVFLFRVQVGPDEGRLLEATVDQLYLLVLLGL